MTDENKLKFDIVIVTRNRLDALSMSIPLMLQQSRKPSRIIVIDSSDDHAPIKSLVEEATNNWGGEVIIKHTDIPSIPRQRNIGLKYVLEEVVFFPDDDSLWHQGVAEYIMNVYESDPNHVIGGVCAKPVTVSPVESLNLAYKKSIKSYIKFTMQPIRNRIENLLFPKPFNLYAHEKWRTLPKIPWLAEMNAVIVENMSGFRMTFRTNVIKKLGFDETVGYKVGYAQHEDMDASLHVLSENLHLVGARNAKVFHHVHPSRRASGYSYGFCQITNYLYIALKYMDKGSRSRSALSRFLLYKLFLYSFGVFNLYKRQVFQGALYAWKHRKTLINAEREELKASYMKLVDQHVIDFSDM
jgi:glycosyltransferase involved in cell wall biosynthesis